MKKIQKTLTLGSAGNILSENHLKNPNSPFCRRQSCRQRLETFGFAQGTRRICTEHPNLPIRPQFCAGSPAAPIDIRLACPRPATTFSKLEARSLDPTPSSLPPSSSTAAATPAALIGEPRSYRRRRHQPSEVLLVGVDPAQRRFDEDPSRPQNQRRSNSDLFDPIAASPTQIRRTRPEFAVADPTIQCVPAGYWI